MKESRTHDTRGLRTAIQAIGVYFLCQCLWYFMDGITQGVLWPLAPPRSWSISPTFTTVLRYLVYAVQYLLLAWLLLVKTDWCVRVLGGLSRPGRADAASEAEA